MKANEMHYFSTLFGKVLYMFRTDLLSISRSLNTVFTMHGPLNVKNLVQLMYGDFNIEFQLPPKLFFFFRLIIWDHKDGDRRNFLILQYTGCNRTNGPDFGSVPEVKLYRYNPKHLYPKLNGYRDIGQRKEWTSLVSAYCTLSVTSYSPLHAAPATLATGQLLAAYSGWKSMDNYDTCASVFVVLFNGFMSLTSYFDVMYRY